MGVPCTIRLASDRHVTCVHVLYMFSTCHCTITCYMCTCFCGFIVKAMNETCCSVASNPNPLWVQGYSYLSCCHVEKCAYICYTLLGSLSATTEVDCICWLLLLSATVRGSNLLFVYLQSRAQHVCQDCLHLRCVPAT